MLHRFIYFLVFIYKLPPYIYTPSFKLPAILYTILYIYTSTYMLKSSYVEVSVVYGHQPKALKELVDVDGAAFVEVHHVQRGVDVGQHHPLQKRIEE